MREITDEVKKVIIGKDEVVDMVFAAILAQGHVWSAMICAACSCNSGVGRPSTTFAWPVVRKPLFSSSSTVSGRLSRRRLLASALRLLPSLRAACSCKKRKDSYDSSSHLDKH